MTAAAVAWPSWGAVSEGAARVAVIGGGPSFANVDAMALRRGGKSVTVIAVNEAAARLPADLVDVSFTIDSGILRTRMPFYPGRRYAAVPDDYGTPGARKKGWRQPPCRACDLVLLRRQAAPWLSVDPTTIAHAGHSGSGAINLARHMLAAVCPVVGGDRRLVLLGLDQRDLDTYWWGPGRAAQRDWEFDTEFMRNAARRLDAEHVQVLNGSPDSRVDAWTRVPPEEAIAWLTA